MLQNKTSISTNILLVLGSFLFCLFLLLVGELLCRIFCDFPLVGNSPKLFIANAYGTSMGNARNAEAVSYGMKVYTDKYGFRAPKNLSADKKIYKEAILILGDSVGFGVGLDEDRTFAALLRKKFPLTKIYNSSVIGYNIPDYKNVIEHFLPLHKEIKRVYLLFCLNDISLESAQQINEMLGTLKINPKSSKGFTFLMMKINFVRKLNQFLRARSKLYLLIRHFLTDPQLLYWKVDRRLYSEENHLHFLKMMQPIVDIATTLKDQNILFTVIIIPYELQLRNKDISTWIPQKKLSLFFEETGVNYINAHKTFKSLGIDSKKFYLTYDPMHFSEEGHRVIYEIILETLRSDQSINVVDS